MTMKEKWPKIDQKMMKAALEQAKLAILEGDQPFGTVIVKDEAIIGRGKSQDIGGGTVIEHAEIMALIEACRTNGGNNLQGATLYTTNEPCPMCAAAIFQAKIDLVKIGLLRTDLPGLLRPRKVRIFELAEDSGYPIKIESGLLKEEIMAVFQDFLARKK